MAFLLWEDSLKLIKGGKAKPFEFLFLSFFFSFKENSLQMIKFGTHLLEMKLTIIFGEEQLRTHVAAQNAFLSQA